MIVDTITEKTVISITIVPSPSASSVSVPEVAHMTAARPMRPYAALFDIFTVKRPLPTRGISPFHSRTYANMNAELVRREV